MGTEESRKVVLKYHEHLRDRQIPEVLAMLKDDVDWWIIGKPHYYPPGGSKTKEEVADIFRFLDANLPNWFVMKLQNVIAENDRVAVEWESHAITKEDLREKLWVKVAHFLIKVPEACKSEP